MQKSFVRNYSLSMIMGLGSDAQSGCCRRQPGVKSRKKEEENRRKNRDKEEKRGEDVRRQSETWMRDIGMQIGDTGRAWWIQ